VIAGTFNRGGIVLCCGLGLVMFLQSDAEYSSRCRATTSVRSLPLPQIDHNVFGKSLPRSDIARSRMLHVRLRSKCTLKAFNTLHAAKLRYMMQGAVTVS